MTDIQVKFWANNENVRHNQATEYETNRHNVATENQAANELQETVRSHKMNELLTHQQNLETQRHNAATELLGIQTLGETIRHNKLNEGIALFQAQETYRHNVATEKNQQYANTTQRMSAQSQAELNHAKVKTEESQTAKNQADTAKTRADTALVKAKTKTEGYTQDKIISDTELNEQKKKESKANIRNKTSAEARGWLQMGLSYVKDVMSGVSSIAKLLG